MKKFYTLIAFVVVFAAANVAGCQMPNRSRGEGVYSQMFLGNFIGLEGLGFAGRVDDAHTPDNPFAGEQLMMTIERASSTGARIKLRVGEDRSRTWILTTEPNGRLRLRHDHRDADGTPHDLTDYGGVASLGGSATRQVFPADDATAEMLPVAATNIWTMEFDRAGRTFTYDLTRDGLPRFRVVFDMSRAAETPWMER